MMKNKKIQAQQKYLEKRLMFKYLLQLDSAGVYALINEKDKKILIKSSNSIVKSMFDAVANIKWHSKELNKDKKKLQLLILTTCDINVKEIEKAKLIEQYRISGYSLYNKEKIPAYRIKKNPNERMKIQVSVVSAGKRVYDVAEFNTDAEASVFIAETNVYDMLKIARR